MILPVQGDPVMTGIDRHSTDASSSSAYYKRKTCRACGNHQLRPFLSLGPMPLANAFLQSPDEFVTEQFYPLDVYFCEACSLVQLLDVINPEALFRNYVYVTGTSDTMMAHNRQYARTVVDELQLTAKDLVVEVASNDGSLLRCFQPYGVRTLGIEPAVNIAAMATASGVETITRFFDASAAQQIRDQYGYARVVIGNNVLAHVDETLDFLCGCRNLLAENGLLVLEVPYLGDLLDRLEYDTIYHEHLCYFSVSALLRLCEAADLSVRKIEHLPVHGGSLRVYAARRKASDGYSSQILAKAQTERNAGLTEFSRYERFAADVLKGREALREMLDALKGRGITLAGYGAPAKGNTLLNFCGIGTTLASYTVDKNPLKIGLYTPGMHLPVLPVSALLERQPDYLLILAWNFADEIMQQQQEYHKRGGRFIIPIPEPQVV